MTRVVRVAIALMTVLAGTAFTLGVPGLIWAATLAELPPTLRPGVPVMMDGGLAIMGLAAAVRRSQGKPARFAWCWLGGLTVASMTLQVAHVVILRGAEGFAPVIGSALAASFPLLVFASTHVLLDLAVAPAPTRARRRAAAAGVLAASAAAAQPVRDSTASGRTRTTTSRRITRVDPAAVRALAAQGLPQRAIAEQLGVGKGSVQRALLLSEGVAA